MRPAAHPGHAGLAGQYMNRTTARVSVDVELHSEFAIAIPSLRKHLTPGDFTICEPADTIGRLREVKERGVKVLSICKVQGSMITREADGHDSHARRAGNRRRLNQSFHGANDRALSFRHVSLGQLAGVR